MAQALTTEWCGRIAKPDKHDNQHVWLRIIKVSWKLDGNYKLVQFATSYMIRECNMKILRLGGSNMKTAMIWASNTKITMVWKTLVLFRIKF